MTNNPYPISAEHNHTDKPETLMINIGESYEYLRTIAKNSIEIKKLEMLKTAQNAAGKIVLFLILGILLSFISILSLMLLTYGLHLYFGSWLYGILASMGLLVIISLLLFFSRRIFVYKVIQSIVNKISL
ncbi:MAG: hypothetical protein HKO66_09795 [Saprospiraceae bacterium]|nr:hypothetical protein [Bacteroidia bacterium]NNE14609.1 hypothetical protein [Saprospiraceae bacterium]NNL92512.1 hypothetical protein [Saprospiraceae bacterium]